VVSFTPQRFLWSFSNLVWHDLKVETVQNKYEGDSGVDVCYTRTTI